ncbi:hypothetical protein C1170_06135 [Stutzerimonas frequens]|uniref:Uncharacterized protein n=1 Tax=Stutzerimonas frequens TaxID=2968969 RepID=A0ABX6XY61_9GAMM|nr:hypothetical protein [Stutzerimonas frequens]MCQ4302726.1 hypothetical protein [Stutzerimonas frequens]PNF52515.1 hypothetical protein C1170_06135 [Stutzerimonas frequens]QPT18996.1 hypothetical protein I6G34_06435 [Stutzerimonas frequens]
MVIHYSASNGNVACGRTGSSLNSSADATQVSCKLCLRSVEKAVSEPVRKTPSLAELRAAAKAAKTVAVAPAAVATTATTAPAAAIKAAPTAPDAAAKPGAVPSVRAEWHKRLEQLPGRNRQPRGVARQAFI